MMAESQKEITCKKHQMQASCALLEVASLMNIHHRRVNIIQYGILMANLTHRPFLRILSEEYRIAGRSF